MTTEGRVWVDFLKTDNLRRILLTTIGTTRDLQMYGIKLKEGLPLPVYSDDKDESGKPDHLLADGVVRYDTESKRWLLEIDWTQVRHESDLS
jgi:hypothetical protein